MVVGAISRHQMNSTPFQSPDLPLRIGAPVWACGDWAGQVYPPRTRRTDWLHWYSRTFNIVEGNSTFYALPPVTTFEKWSANSVDGFQFSFKFPKLISHDLQLVNADEVTRDFLDRLAILAKADRLGPTFLQLGPSFGPERLGILERYLRSLPKELPWAVELRHFDWFDATGTAESQIENRSNEHRVNELLSDLGIDKVLFDSRPLFQAEPDDPIEVISQGKKPKTPVRQTVTAKRPMLRIVGRNRVEMADRFFAQWAPIVAHWINDGLEPIVFTHAPDDRFAPELARRFLAALGNEMPNANLGLPAPEMPTPQIPDDQLSLFDEQD